MITTGVGLYTCLLIIMAVILYVSNRFKNAKIFNYIPGLVWMMIIVALMATFHVFDLESESLQAGQNLMYSTFLPMMLTLFMLTCDIRNIIKMGPKFSLVFLMISFFVMIGLGVSFLILRGGMGPGAWGSFASVSGSWIGETINMVSVASSFGVEGTDYVYAVLLDTVGFPIVSAVAFSLIPHAAAWNKKFKAKTQDLDEIARKIDEAESKRDHSAPTVVDYAILLAIGFGAAAIINYIIGKFPESMFTFLSFTGWRVVLSAALGVILGLTPLHWLKGATDVANVFLYMSLCITMSYSDLSTATSAPAFAIAAIVAVVIILSLWVIASKIFKIDLFTASVCLMANFGGTSSAPIMAAAHNTNWISFGIMMGFFGDLVGTPLAIAFGNILKSLV